MPDLVFCIFGQLFVGILNPIEALLKDEYTAHRNQYGVWESHNWHVSGDHFYTPGQSLFIPFQDLKRLPMYVKKYFSLEKAKIYSYGIYM